MTTGAIIMFKDGRPPMFVGGSRKTDEIYFEGTTLKVKDTDGFIHNHHDILIEDQTKFIASHLDTVPDVDVIVIIDDVPDEVMVDLPVWALKWIKENNEYEDGIYHIWVGDSYIGIREK